VCFYNFPKKKERKEKRDRERDRGKGAEKNEQIAPGTGIMLSKKDPDAIKKNKTSSVPLGIGS
jgi:hypothetical protein